MDHEKEFSNNAKWTKASGEIILKYNDICRVCANVRNPMIPIFKDEGAKHELSNKIHRYLPIEVSETDSLPLKLCYHCASTLLAWHKLIDGCLAAEKKLLAIQTNFVQSEANRTKDTEILRSDRVAEQIVLDSAGSASGCHPIESQKLHEQCAISAATRCGDQERSGANRNDREETVCSMFIEKTNLNAASKESLAARNLMDSPEPIVMKKVITANSAQEEEEEEELARIHEQDESCALQPVERTSENENQCIFGQGSAVRSDGSRSDGYVISGKKRENPSPKSETIDPEIVAISNRPKRRNAWQPNSCPKCNKVFPNLANFKRHSANCNGNNRNNDEFTDSTEKTNERKFVGEAAEGENNKTRRLAAVIRETNCSDEREHRKNNRRTSYPCQHCDYTARTKKLLDQHVIELHSEKSDNPKVAKRKNIDRDIVERAKMESDGRVYYHCDDCGKNLFSPYTFAWHVRIHTGERPFTCHLCGKQFRVNQGLTRHLRETHAGIKKFACDICDRMFSTKRNVDDHRRTHTGERPYVCNVCGKTFKQKSSLFVHNRTHTNYFPFECNYCGQGFRTRTPLVIHMTKHTGEKSHCCDICHRAFRIKYELKRHRLVHSDEKPWRCLECGTSFRQKRYLVNHKRINHVTNGACRE